MRHCRTRRICFCAVLALQYCLFVALAARVYDVKLGSLERLVTVKPFHEVRRSGWGVLPRLPALLRALPACIVTSYSFHPAAFLNSSDIAAEGNRYNGASFTASHVL